METTFPETSEVKDGRICEDFYMHEASQEISEFSSDLVNESIVKLQYSGVPLQENEENTTEGNLFRYHETRPPSGGPLQ